MHTVVRLWARLKSLGACSLCLSTMFAFRSVIRICFRSFAHKYVTVTHYLLSPLYDFRVTNQIYWMYGKKKKKSKTNMSDRRRRKSNEKHDKSADDVARLRKLTRTRTGQVNPTWPSPNRAGHIIDSRFPFENVSKKFSGKIRAKSCTGDFPSTTIPSEIHVSTKSKTIIVIIKKKKKNVQYCV